MVKPHCHRINVGQLEINMSRDYKKLIFQMRELLATIHCDGGHHTEEVGILQSIKDAIIEINKIKQILAEHNLN